MWTEDVYDTIEEYVEAAKEFPDDIMNMMHWAVYESDTPCCDNETEFVQAFVDAGAVSQKMLNMLLAHAAEYRMLDLAEVVLNAGANPNERVPVDWECAHASIIDVLLWGHGGYDRDSYETVIPMWHLLNSHSAVPTIRSHTRQAMEQDNWHGFMKSPEYRALVNNCNIV